MDAGARGPGVPLSAAAGWVGGPAEANGSKRKHPKESGSKRKNPETNGRKRKQTEESAEPSSRGGIGRLPAHPLSSREQGRNTARIGACTASGIVWENRGASL